MKIELSKQSIRDLKKVPMHVAVKLKAWVDLVEENGLMAARKIPGYHD